MVEVNQWVLMGERNRPKKEEESWRAESTGVMGDEESNEGLTEKHERKKQRILKQINGFVIKSSDHGSSSNDAEGVRSLIRIKEIQFYDKLAAEKVAKEMERIEYEAQLAAKEAQHRQDREQYAVEKFELKQRIMHLELEWQKLLFEANTERQWNPHVPLNYGYPIPSLAPLVAAS
uniref:Uncharacterized protein n=1 Tax=Fagus sylvatica TaxID=28930 RepID=A0A2N9IZW1_FAGSY